MTTVVENKHPDVVSKIDEFQANQVRIRRTSLQLMRASRQIQPQLLSWPNSGRPMKWNCENPRRSASSHSICM
jgi:hypothetical protein